MKMTQENFETIKVAIEEFDTDHWRKFYRNRSFPRADMVKDINKRYRWDLFHVAKLSWEFKNNLYELNGLNDSHIDTALRKIVSPL